MQQVAPNIEELFFAARELKSPEARLALLDQACSGTEARRRVEELLAVDAEANDFLAAPAAMPTVIAAHESRLAIEEVGTVIGPYKLLEPIGEGGMGTVYMAEQAEPVRRCVALKVIKPGMDSKHVIARFEAERQALAMMDHPNIAKVHDGGMTPSGRPYFVMELVRGIPITEYCDREQLSIRGRLDLFVLVCRAVQHAHQKGIIHRDLKPANILVTVIDGAAVPKVIDFGIAKAIGQALTEKTFQTAFAQMIGTPLYMSPEQADFSGVDVDTRSDIYSLGVLLYELLTGTTPFDSETLKRAAFDEMCRIIREDEPPKPSTKIKAEGGRMKDESKTTSQVQALFRRPFSSFIPHPSSFQEVDWIVMKALEKDRARRYETANDFAADVMRYLTDQPVAACPASAWYRFGKFARRNRPALAVTAAAALGLAVLGGVVAMVAFDRAALRLAAADALAEADHWGGAERRAEELEAVKRAEALLDGGRGGAARSDGVRRRRAALELALRFEAIQLEQAAVRDEDFDQALGDRLYAEAFGVIGVDPDAQPPEESARRLPSGPIRAAFVAALDDWARVRRGMSTTADRDRWKRPMAAAAAADSDPWRAAVRAALMTPDLKALRKLQAEAPRDGLVGPSDAILLQCVILDSNVWAVLREAQRRRPDNFWLAHALARHFQTAGPPDLPESLAYYRAALALRPTSPGVLLNFGTALDAAGRHDEALATYRQAIVLKPDYSNAHNNLGQVLAKLGRRREAIAAFREALRLKPDNHATLLNLSRALHENGESAKALGLIREALRLRPDDSDALLYLGTILPAAGGDIDEAERAFREAIRRQPKNPQSFNGLGSLLANHRGRYAAAIEEFRRAIEVAPDYAPAHENLGRCLQFLNDHAAALAAFDEAIRLDPKNGSAHDRRAVALADLGRLGEATDAARKALELDPNLATAHQTLGVALGMKADQDATTGPLGAIRALAGRPPEVVAELRRAVALDPNNFSARYALGTELLKRSEWTDAAAELAAVARRNPDYPEAHCNLGHALRELGRLDEALAELRRGHELGSKRPGWSYSSADWVAECQALIEKGRTAPARGPVPRE